MAVLTPMYFKITLDTKPTPGDKLGADGLYIESIENCGDLADELKRLRAEVAKVAHDGNPCKYCGQAHNEVRPGICPGLALEPNDKEGPKPGDVCPCMSELNACPLCNGTGIVKECS